MFPGIYTSLYLCSPETVPWNLCSLVSIFPQYIYLVSMLCRNNFSKYLSILVTTECVSVPMSSGNCYPVPMFSSNFAS